MEIPKEMKRMALHIIDRSEFEAQHEKDRLDHVRNHILNQIKEYKKDRKRFEEINNDKLEVKNWIESMGYSVNDLKEEIYSDK